MVRLRDRLALLILIGLGLAYQLCLFREGVGLIDEGHLANAARRVAAGEILYRDVYTVYPPASFQIVAWLFELFGTSLFVVRGLHIALTLALSGLVFVAGRRFMETPFAWLAGALVAATGWHVILEGCHYASLYGAFADLFLAVFWTSFGQYLQGGEFNLSIPAFEWFPVEWSRLGLPQLFVSWEFRLPVLLYAVTVAEVALAAWRRRRSSAGTPPIAAESLARLALALFGAVPCLRATGRSDYYHLAPVLFPAYLLGVDWIARAWRRFVPPRRNALAYPLVALVLASSLTLHQFDLAVYRAFDPTDEVEVVPGGPRIARADQLDDLVVDVRARTRPGESIVVLPWYPIVYSPISIDGRSDRSLAAFAPEIDRFLRRRFQPIRRYGHFWVLTRKDAPSEQP